MQTFLTPIKLHTLVKNMFLHKNPDSIYNIYDVDTVKMSTFESQKNVFNFNKMGSMFWTIKKS